MAYNNFLHGKYYDKIDLASGGCRVRNIIIKKWKETNDLSIVIQQIISSGYEGINVAFLLEIKEEYEEGCSDENEKEN